MEAIDKIIFGDNQFFGINHMSQEKAQQLMEKYSDINSIYCAYEMAFEAGIRAVMLNSNDRAKDICNFFRSNKSKYQDLCWYPSIPYPHKYAKLVAEKGVLSAINEILFNSNSVMGVLGMVTKGSIALLNKNAIKMMQMLIDVEMKIYSDLNIKVIFLQNIITDLLLGYCIREVFFEYCEYIRKKYKVIPGFITQNLSFLIEKLNEWEIREVVICSSFNKIGYLMSPNIEANIETVKRNNPINYQLVAMSTLASGAISAKDAYSFINQQNIQGVVFGSSDRRHIEETIKLIEI